MRGPPVMNHGRSAPNVCGASHLTDTHSLGCALLTAGSSAVAALL